MPARLTADGSTLSPRRSDRLVDVLDDDVADPVRDPVVFERPEAAVLNAVRPDHRIVDLAGLPGLDLPAEELRIEAHRPLYVGRQEVMPDELPDLSLHACAHWISFPFSVEDPT